MIPLPIRLLGVTGVAFQGAAEIHTGFDPYRPGPLKTSRKTRPSKSAREGHPRSLNEKFWESYNEFTAVHHLEAF